MLWGLLAASIPVIIHLLNRRRFKTVKWAAMQFLLKATRESRGKKRLRHILILTCRTLGIAALITAAAIPIVSSLFGFGSGKPDLIVLVLDRSASMEANPKSGTISRRVLALQRVQDAMADLDGTRLVLIDSANGIPQDVPSPDVLAELSSTAPTDTAAKLPALLATTAEFLAQTQGRSEVWIASDLQSSSWEPENDRWASVRAALASLPQQPQVRVLALGGESALNQSIRVISSRRAGPNLVLDLEIVRGVEASAPLDLPLTTNLNGARSTENINIAGQRIRFHKTLPISTREESGQGWVSIPGDGNPRDNVAFFAYGPALPVSSALVTPAGEAADYLSLATAPSGFGGQKVEVVAPASGSGLTTTELAAVIWAAPLPDGPAAAELERFINEGGQVLFFPPLKDSNNSFLGITWSGVGKAATDKFFILDSWDHKDGLLRDGIDGSPIPGERLRAVKRRVPEGEASIMARWDDTEPFLVRRVVGRGTAWFIGSLPDYSWSNLGDADVLLPAVQRGVISGAERFDSGYLAVLGSAAAQPKPDEVRERLDEYGTTARAEPENLAGVFRFGERTLAINRPANEDVTDVLEKNSLNSLFEGTSFTLFEDTSGSGQKSISRGVWRAFLIGVLFFLLAEALLCMPRKPVAAPTVATGPPVQHAR